MWGRWFAFAFVAVAADAHAACRSDALTFSARDISLELADYGTLFREASMPECRGAVHDALLRKLRLSLAEPQRLEPVFGRPVGTFERWLAGAHLGLIVPTAMQLGGAGLLDAVLDHAVRASIAAYRFNIDPSCGLNYANECMDDFTQAAAAYAWSAAYEHASGREANAERYAAAARDAMQEALAIGRHTCVPSMPRSMPEPCANLPGAEAGLGSGFYDIVSFNHGFQNVAYGIGLMTSLSSAALALDVAGQPFAASEEQTRVAWALFREGQAATTADGFAFRADCIRMISGLRFDDARCADADYLPRMFPVRTFYERSFHNAPNSAAYRFDEFDAGLFNTAFINDGRYAVYIELGERWWHVRPALDGYRGVPLRGRTVRH